MKSLQIKVKESYITGFIHESELDNGYVLIISHGFRGSIDGGNAYEIAERASKLGFKAVRYNFTPCRPLSTQIEELDAVVKYCTKNLSNKIILMGRSMGGSATIAYSANYFKPEGLILWATPTDLDECFRLILKDEYNKLKNGKTLKIEDEKGKVILEPAFVTSITKYNLQKDINDISNKGIDILFIHGDSDSVVPLKQTIEVFNNSKANEELHVIKGAAHDFEGYKNQITEITINWLKMLHQGKHI